MDEDFAAFAVEIAPRLMRLARTLVVSEHDAADLVQDTLVRVGTRWARVERRGNPVSYSMTILVRLNIDRHRKQSRESPTREMPDSPAPLIAESAGIPEWLSTAWPGLTPNQRTAIALRHLEDFDIAEIAAVIRCSEATVRTHLSRGIQRLREQLLSQAGRGS